jgi:hypothetical protein
MVNYLFVFCLLKVLMCIFDKSDRKKKAITAAKTALFNSFSKVWCGSKFIHAAGSRLFAHCLIPTPSGKTRVQVKVATDTTASGVTDGRYLCKQIGQFSAQLRDCAFSVVFSYCNTGRRARWLRSFLLAWGGR